MTLSPAISPTILNRGRTRSSPIRPHTPKGCAVIGSEIAGAILHGVREPELEEVEAGTSVLARPRMLETKKSSIAAAG